MVEVPLVIQSGLSTTAELERTLLLADGASAVLLNLPREQVLRVRGAST